LKKPTKSVRNRRIELKLVGNALFYKGHYSLDFSSEIRYKKGIGPLWLVYNGSGVQKPPIILWWSILKKQRVIAYIDGFNLFYGSLKGSPYKWLDIHSLCKALLRPSQELISIKYFSARVSSFKGDLSKTNRQDIYLDALRDNPKIEVMLGYFSMHPVKMPATKEFEAAVDFQPAEAYADDTAI
jgi:hypothetical protein